MVEQVPIKRVRILDNLDIEKHMPLLLHVGTHS
jgi:hypothetical protein